VVGDGPARAGLERQAKELGIANRVTFTGIVERDDVARYVNAFDIALQPAVVAYASPLKLFEYLALGKAIVGPAQPNIEEILRQDHNAVLFDPADPNGLAGAVSRLCSDHALRTRVAENAQRTIADMELTWGENARKVAKLFGGLSSHA
jgi:glycosyltransferase involved in cell wall biosynthesis